MKKLTIILVCLALAALMAAGSIDLTIVAS
jgi:hypothetical protein